MSTSHNYDLCLLNSEIETKGIILKLEEGTFKDDFLDSPFNILLFFNHIEIGYIEGYEEDNHIHIELFYLVKKYRRKGYGSIAIQLLKNIGKSFMLKYIDGECKNDLKGFYRNLGADFTHRQPEDPTYINNRFYIDL